MNRTNVKETEKGIKELILSGSIIKNIIKKLWREHVNKVHCV